MKFKNAVAVAALMGHLNAIKIKSNGKADDLLESQKPEEQNVTQVDINTYADLVSQGETFSKIKSKLDA